MRVTLNSIKAFLERTTLLGEIAQRRRQKRGRNRPTETRKEEKGFAPLGVPNCCEKEVRQEWLKKLGSRIYRSDYIIIWGHGVRYTKEIIEMIRSNNNFRIVRFLYHKPKTIGSLVRAVYSYDYAPLRHLRSKTRYLKKTPKEVLFIFIENNKPSEDYFGKGIFRHFESTTLKQLKEEIRNKFNDRINGRRTEDHVIHASDNSLQTHHILQYLGYKGLGYLQKTNGVINLPPYLAKYKNFVIRNVSVDSLVCNIVVGEPENYRKKTVVIKDSPQYGALAGDVKSYEDYICKYRGRALTADYSVEKFMGLAKNFEYLAPPYSTDYIAVYRKDGKFLVVDGLHRAAIMMHQEVEYIPVTVLK